MIQGPHYTGLDREKRGGTTCGCAPEPRSATNQRQPFLAHLSSKSATVLVFTQLAGLGPQQIGIAALGKTGSGVTSLASGVVYSAPTGPVANSAPRTPVVAAGSYGFGVAWVHDVAVDHPEVFFKWVGCLP